MKLDWWGLEAGCPKEEASARETWVRLLRSLCTCGNGVFQEIG